MPVQKHHGKFRARLAVAGKWQIGPQRSTESEATEDMRQLEAVKDQGIVAIETVFLSTAECCTPTLLYDSNATPQKRLCTLRDAGPEEVRSSSAW